ncbi:MAG: HEAT repeat domain-containing protein [Deltaproteobacteria bacterium]|nr:HEAT repeat domain-containing protein [Deltaproteobacteria bacterium]
MTHGSLHRGAILTLLVLDLVAKPLPGLAEAQQDSVRALIEAGRYAEAYDATLRTAGTQRIAALAETARTLLSVSLESHDSYLQWGGLNAARSLREKDLTDDIRRLARSDDRYARSLALELLTRLDPQSGREEFLAALDSPFRSVRLRALQGLARLNDRALAERFGAVLTGDSDPDLRAFAARALAEIGGPEAVALLYRAVDDPIMTVQEEAVRGLVALHDGGIADVVRRRLNDHPPAAGDGIIRLAGLIPDRTLVDGLGPLLADPDPQVRASAAAAILSIVERTTPAKR